MKLTTTLSIATGLGALALAFAGCGDSGGGPAPRRSSSSGSAPSTVVSVEQIQLAGVSALPADFHKSGAKPSSALVDLGRTLYYENRLSKSGTISCNSCHQLDRFGVDGEPTSPGHDGSRGDRNSPTSLNAAGQFRQFWDGRAADVEEQAKGPILNPIEHGMASEEDVVGALKGIAGYAELFAAAFPGQGDPITFDNFAHAVGAFERGLSTPSRFDDFLAGKADALSYKEQLGLKTFLDTGCTTCHNGPLLGGQSYDKLGKLTPWPNAGEDKGRSKVTGQSSDDWFFKVPSLRNVTKTGPYLHNGSIADLKQVVTLMAKHQLGKPLSDGDAENLLAFLATLEGRVDANYVRKPTMPE